MTTQTLRPNATRTTVGSTSVTGAASAHAALSDNSDSSYTQLDSLGSYVWCELGTFSLPAGALVRQIAVRARARAQGSAGSLFVGVDVNGGSELASLSVVGALTSSVTDYAGSPVAVSLSQADIDALTIYNNVGFSSPGGLPRVMELYLDVVYATQPVVVVSGPSGTLTDTSSPLVEWAYTPGDDGGAQSRFEVRVFSAAQYGISGFNPATSPATFQTGSVASSAPSVEVGPLPNGTTFRAYVRAAQSINGVAHWSEWDYTEFDLDLDTADVLSVAAVGQNDNGRVRLTVTRDPAGEDWDDIEVERSDDGGVSWVWVRGAYPVVPSGDVWIGYDYESANGATVRYRARARHVIDGVTTIVGPWTESNTTAWSSTSTWLKDLADATLSRRVRIASLPSMSRAITQGVIDVIGRPAPVVVTDVRRTVQATVTFMSLDDTEAADMLALLTGRPLLLQTAVGDRWGSRYIVPMSANEARFDDLEGEPGAYWPVPVVEIDRPADEGLFIGGVTWGDMAELYPTETWEDMGDLFPGAVWGDFV